MEKATSNLPFTRHDTYEPLLDNNDDSNSEAETRPARGRSIWHKILLCIFALYVVATSTYAFMALCDRNKGPLQPYSPASYLLSYQTKPLYFDEDPKFAGLPEDVDEAWEQLLEPINIRASKEEIEQSRSKLTDDIVRVVDGDYVAVLSVHHELHCLDALRRRIFPEYYNKNQTAQEAEYEIYHLTHCVDTIRRSLMCKADVAMYTAYWIGDHTAIPSKELRSNSDTVCVDWEAIDGWARQRLLPKDKYKVRPGPFEKHLG